MEISKAGKLPANKTEIPFEIPLKTKGNKPLYETYHGVFINVQVSKRLVTFNSSIKLYPRSIL